MVLGHVGFELFGVGARGRLPSGLFGGAVEIVREVFGVGVADFPGGGKAGVRLEGGFSLGDEIGLSEEMCPGFVY